MAATENVVRQWPGTNPVAMAYSEVVDSFVGMCRLELDQKQFAVFPSYQIAVTAAVFAINGEIGGYCCAVIKAAEPEDRMTHETAEVWLFS